MLLPLLSMLASRSDNCFSPSICHGHSDTAQVDHQHFTRLNWERARQTLDRVWADRERRRPWVRVWNHRLEHGTLEHRLIFSLLVTLTMMVYHRIGSGPEVAGRLSPRPLSHPRDI